MATKSHKTLTGNQLHEPKGADAASDDYVMTVTSNASVWKKLTAANLTGTGNSFGAQLLHAQELLTSGVGPSTVLTNGGWGNRILNTSVTNEIASATLTAATGTLSLPAGTYYVEADAVLSTTGSGGATAKLRLRNSTDGATLLSGLNTSLSGAGVSVWSWGTSLKGRFTLAGTKNVNLQNYYSSSINLYGGSAMSSGESEIYTDLRIWRLS